jgi:dTDP-4-amino-4,6-dideoxygalactose transaminase
VTGRSSERVPWVRPILESDESLLADIRMALSSGRVTNDGPYVREFERQVARYLGVDDCVAVSSGSAALLLAIWALGLHGTKAVLPSFTFLATLNAIVLSGVTPVFCDIEPDTWTISPTHLGRLLAADPAIRLVVPVNVFGVQPDLRAIRRVVDGSNAVLVLDNAHGLGTEQGAVRCPLEASLQAYSFHATKTLPAVEGGAVVASDPRLLAEIRRLRNHGVASDPLASMPGFNAKMSELHAAVGLRSLQGLEAALARRREYAERLCRVLTTDCAETFTVQVIPDGMRSNFQNLGVLCRRGGRPDVPAVQAQLDRAGIETRRYFWPPLHQLSAYRGRFSLPITDAVGESILCLPLHSRMEPSVLDRIEAALRHTASAVR